MNCKNTGMLMMVLLASRSCFSRALPGVSVLLRPKRCVSQSWREPYLLDCLNESCLHTCTKIKKIKPQMSYYRHQALLMLGKSSISSQFSCALRGKGGLVPEGQLARQKVDGWYVHGELSHRTQNKKSRVSKP